MNRSLIMTSSFDTEIDTMTSPSLHLPQLENGDYYRYHVMVKPSGSHCNLDVQLLLLSAQGRPAAAAEKPAHERYAAGGAYPPVYRGPDQP